MSNSIRFSPTRPSILALLLALPLGIHAGVDIDQMPLTVGKPLEPNLWFILDDSGSMGYNYMPDGLSSNGITRTAYVRNTIYYNPAVTYTPWMNADGTSMPDAVRTSVSNNDSSLESLIDLTTAARCFHVPKSSTIDHTLDSNLNRWRLDSGGATASLCAANTDCSVGTSSGKKADCKAVSTFTWTRPDGTTVTRTIDEEWQNYANWYHYYRTRIKMAKASVSQAFSSLGEDFRVGYTSIWNRNKFDIPVETYNGRFLLENRSKWYANLFLAAASGNTPLRAALDRAGQYFSNDAVNGPYGPGAVSDQLSCRQNFTILTTDGYWNDAAAGTDTARANNDNTDGPVILNPKSTPEKNLDYQYKPTRPFMDTHSNTLADVAMYYWKRDLRSDLSNDVPTTTNSPGFWQHMRTFGISIGLKGSLDPEVDLDALVAGTKSWPSPITNTTTARIDDLWHAALNSRGEFLVASDPEEFTKVLKDTLDVIGRERGRSASGAASSTSVTEGSMTFFSDFLPGAWEGDIFSRDLKPADPLSPASWSANKMLPKWSDRKIYIKKGTTLALFNWSNLLPAQQTALGSEQVVNYLRGDQSNEKTDANTKGTLRSRESLLGTFVNSQPVYVGQPPYSKYYGNATTPGAKEYAKHSEDHKGRTPVLYVGSNGGMLHGFDAETGEELFAFMPSAVMTEELRKYSVPGYQHHYFVDGELTVAEAYLGGKEWRTVLVGSLGRGGRSVFALDVTNPTSITLLWEKTAADIPEMGNVLGKPIIAEVGEDSDWRVLIGNGPNSNGDKAQLITISLNDGSVTVIDTGAGGDNGLSAVLSWDGNKDGLFETVYAGDLNGNVWRFDDVFESSPPKPFKLFTAKGSQPITAAPWAAVNQRDGRTWVFVGSGQFLNEIDREDTTTQTWFGLIDENVTLTMADLRQRKILSSGTIAGRGVRTLEAGSTSDITGSGWYIDFTLSGERMITPNSFYGSALMGTTFIPDGTDPCKPGGRSALWAVSPFTGARLNQAVFDVNRNGNYSDDTSGGMFPSILDGLKPILVGVPPITTSTDGESVTVTMHTDPDESEQFRPASGDAEFESWREVIGE